jgi:hypothetical protein
MYQYSSVWLNFDWKIYQYFSVWLTLNRITSSGVSLKKEKMFIRLIFYGKIINNQCSIKKQCSFKKKKHVERNQNKILFNLSL